MASGFRSALSHLIARLSKPGAVAYDAIIDWTAKARSLSFTTAARTDWDAIDRDTFSADSRVSTISGGWSYDENGEMSLDEDGTASLDEDFTASGTMQAVARSSFRSENRP